MSQIVHLVLFGQSGAGKSRLGNDLLEVNSHSGTRFNEENSEGGQAYGCQKLHADIDFRGIHYHLRIVNTPGIFHDGVTDVHKYWKDVVKAIYMSERIVHVFLVVLKATEVKISQQVVQSFVHFFGSNATLQTVVVFTDGNKNTTEREIKFNHFDYLLLHMKHDFPWMLWDDGDKERSVNKLMEKIAETTKIEAYDIRQFSDAQMKFTIDWIREQREKKNRVRTKDKDGLIEIGVPDILLTEMLSDENVKSLIPK